MTVLLSVDCSSCCFTVIFTFRNDASLCNVDLCIILWFRSLHVYCTMCQCNTSLLLCWWLFVMYDCCSLTCVNCCCLILDSWSESVSFQKLSQCTLLHSWLSLWIESNWLLIVALDITGSQTCIDLSWSIGVSFNPVTAVTQRLILDN